MALDQLRIMYAAAAPWCTSGYGVQARSLLPRLRALPIVDDVAMMAWHGLMGASITYDGLKLYPSTKHPFGLDMYRAYCDHFEANVIITMIDAWVMDDVAPRVRPVRWLPWFPVDHDPLPARVRRAVYGAATPMVYSKWGTDVAQRGGVPAEYVPIGIEPTEYRVRDFAAVERWRNEHVGEDCRLFGVMIAANKGWPPRKGFIEVFKAWAEVLKKVPSAILYVHADPMPNMDGGDLLALARACGIKDNIRMPEQIKLVLGEYGPDHLSMVLNAADVYLGPSAAEGFGIPLVEAQACGCPVIVTDFSSMPELVRWGRCVPVRDTTWGFLDSWQATIDWRDVASAIMDLYDEQAAMSDSTWEAKRKNVSRAIHDEFAWDTVVEKHWYPVLSRFVDRNEV